MSGKIAAERPVAAVRRGGRVVECTGLENRRPFTGLVSSNLTLSASREFDQIAERFGTPERFGDGARRARARMARVHLALSASREFDKIAGSDFGRAQRARRARAGTARVNLTLSASIEFDTPLG